MNSGLTFMQYQAGLAESRLMALKCDSCGTHTLPPQGVCRQCGKTALSPAEIEKTGTIRTFTVIRVAAEGLTPPFVVALVETASGAWAMGNLMDLDPNAADMSLIGRSVTIDSRVVPGDTYALGDIRALTFRLA